MPIVVSHNSKSVEYFASEQALFELLGHSNFDGADWAVGDLVIFEDGSESTIRLSPDCSDDERFYDCDDGVAGDFDKVLAVINKYRKDKEFAGAEIRNWPSLFKYFEDQHTHAKAQIDKFNTGCMIVLGIIILYLIYLFSP